MSTGETASRPESAEVSVSDTLLAKEEVERLKNRALEKDLELRNLEKSLTQKAKLRNTEIEKLRKNLGTERGS